METFNFCPSSNVPTTLPPEDTGSGFTSSTGWNFSSRPTTPYQRRFKLKLYGLRWVLDDNGMYDPDEAPQLNARALEIFYAKHRTWLPFNFNHQHLGPMVCRFASPVSVPEGMENGGGQIEVVEVTLIQHTPGYGVW